MQLFLASPAAGQSGSAAQKKVGAISFPRKKKQMKHQPHQIETMVPGEKAKEVSMVATSTGEGKKLLVETTYGYSKNGAFFTKVRFVVAQYKLGQTKEFTKINDAIEFYNSIK